MMDTLLAWMASPVTTMWLLVIAVFLWLAMR